MSRARRILFFAEAVTLAHVARPIVLAKGLGNGLDRERYDVFMACHARYQRFLADEPWQTLPLDSISSPQFLRALASGSPVYDVPTLRRYVKEDLALIERVQPDLIVGDFRLSLSVSARLAGIPYATVTNAYWSPYYTMRRFPLPVLPLTRFLPLPVARQLFGLAQPFAFGLHCQPLNLVRKENGLPGLGNDLRRVYTDADHVLYADAPQMFPVDPLPAHHHYLGAILWSPPVALPDWWHRLPADKPIVYLTLGSSGAASLLPTVLQALADLPVTVIASTAGASLPGPPPANAFVADYLPGTEAASRAQLVICNGGSPTSQQALAAGVPVLGIASNMDQFMNMEAIVKAGAGAMLRADRLDGMAIQAAVNSAIGASAFKQNSEALGLAFGQLNAARVFSRLAGKWTA